MKITTYKNGAYTSFEKVAPSGMYAVKVYAPSGALLDKVRCDDYREALAYLRCFKGIARNA
jgi:hypothetical protein